MNSGYAVVVGSITFLCFYFFFSFIFRFSCKKGKKKNCRGVLYVFHECYQKKHGRESACSERIVGNRDENRGLMKVASYLVYMILVSAFFFLSCVFFFIINFLPIV